MPLITIRPATLEDSYSIAKVHVDSWRTTYRNIVPVQYLNQLSYANRTKLWLNILSNHENKVSVAEINGVIVAFIHFSVIEEQGQISAIYIVEAYQQLGIGKRLFATAFDYFKHAKCETAFVHVLKDNNAKHFYFHLGGTIKEKVTIEIEGKQLQELIIQWKQPF